MSPRHPLNLPAWLQALTRLHAAWAGPASHAGLQLLLLLQLLY
jgi:hypothetical protein